MKVSKMINTKVTEISRNGSAKKGKQKRKPDDIEGFSLGDEPLSPAKKEKPSKPKSNKLEGKLSKPASPSKKQSFTPSKGGGKFQKGVNKFSQKKEKPNPTLKKPEESWQEFKSKVKQERAKRKEKSPLAEVMRKTKNLWESLRQRNCPPEEKKKLVKSIYDILHGKIRNVIRAHDISRIIQCLVKNGTKEIRHGILDELLTEIATVAQSKYSNHAIESILAHSDHEMKMKIIETFSGHYVRLLSNKFSGNLVDTLYTDYASAPQCCQIRQELYGDLFKGSKTSASCLSDVFKESPDLKEAILSSTLSCLNKLLAKPHCQKSPLVHDVLSDFLGECNETVKGDLFEKILASVSSFAGTKAGHSIVLKIAQVSSPQVRKKIVGSVKSDVKEIYQNRYGVMLIISLIDLVDDTVRTGGMINDILKDPFEVALNDHSRKILLHLAAHWDSTYFHPADIEFLKQSSQFSKKPPEKKVGEILKNFLPDLLKDIESNPRRWMSTKQISLVSLAILKAATDPPSSVYRAIAEAIVDPEFVISEQNQQWPVIEHPGVHLLLKKLVAHNLDLKSAVTFSEHVLEKLDEDIVERWLTTNRGCFFLVSMLETKIEKVTVPLKKLLATKPSKKALKNASHSGKGVILKLIGEV